VWREVVAVRRLPPAGEQSDGDGDGDNDGDERRLRDFHLALEQDRGAQAAMPSDQPSSMT
jgi:hypothetical protein